MADIKPLIQFISRWEGGFVNDPDDKGGPTNMGVTLKTWKKTGYDKNNDGVIDEADLQGITHQEMVGIVLRPHFWDRWKADYINNQSIANLVVDWMWHSGNRTIPIVQRILNVKPDGIVGKQTLNAINQYPDQKELFEMIKMNRINDIHRICQITPSNMKFKRGWMNRVGALRFAPIIVLMCLLSLFSSCGTAKTKHSSETGNELIVSAQTVVTDNHSMEQSGYEKQSMVQHIDSVVETMLLCFTFGSIADSSNQNLPAVTGRGHALVSRTRKTLFKNTGNEQSSSETTRHMNDSTSRLFAAESEKKHYGSTKEYEQKILHGFVLILGLISICILLLKVN